MKLLSFRLLFSIETVFLFGRNLLSLYRFFRPTEESLPCTSFETFKNIFHAGGEGMNIFIVISLLTPMLHTVEPQNRRRVKSEVLHFMDKSVRSLICLSLGCLSY